MLSCCHANDVQADADVNNVDACSAAISSAASAYNDVSASVCVSIHSRPANFFAAHGKSKDGTACELDTHARAYTHIGRSSNRKSSNENNRCINVGFLHDSGSNAHLTNVKGVLQNIQKCNVNVFGISSDDEHNPIHASEMGSVPLHLNENESILVHDVLFLPDALLGNTEGTPTVLVSTQKLAQQNLSLIHISEPTRPY